MAEDVTEEIEEAEQVLEEFKDSYMSLEDKLESIDELKQDIEKRVDVQASNIDFDRLAEFVRSKYWMVNDLGGNEYEILIPQFMDVQVGVLDRQVGGYNVFILDQTTKMVTGIPEFLQDEVDLEDEQRFKVKGDLLEFEPEEKSTVEEELSEHVEEVQEDKATIKQDKGFELVRDLLENGELPFTPMPVRDEDRREPDTGFELREYQERAYNQWLEHGSLTVCFMTGSGKSFIAMQALDSLEYDEETGRKAVVVYGKATEEQWRNYLEEFAPRLSDEVDIVTYQSLHKLQEKVEQGMEYSMIVYDEAHALPADTFATGATIPTDYRMGLTASPYREDGRQNDIFALAGRPVGLNWGETVEMMDKSFHEINIHTVESRNDKIDRIQEIRDPDKRTLIFVDGIDFGERISEETGLEFVHGKTNKQLETLEQSMESDNACIISRVGDHGISLEDLECIIEADFLYGSRRQQIQRTGRLFHGEGERHDILFTPGEFNKYQKRLYSLIEKGFKLNDRDGVLDLDEIPDKYETQVEMDIGEGEKVVETPSAGAGIPSDPLEFLKHDEVQDIINGVAERSGTKKENFWELLVALAENEGGISKKELKGVMSVGREPIRIVVKELSEYNPPIIERGKDGGEKKWRINVEDIQELLEKERERREKREKIDSLKKEVLGE